MMASRGNLQDIAGSVDGTIHNLSAMQSLLEKGQVHNLLYEMGLFRVHAGKNL